MDFQRPVWRISVSPTPASAKSEALPALKEWEENLFGGKPAAARDLLRAWETWWLVRGLAWGERKRAEGPGGRTERYSRRAALGQQGSELGRVRKEGDAECLKEFKVKMI